MQELKAMIAGTIAACPDTKQRWKAMKSIQWRLRGPVGQFVGLNAEFECAFVPESDAMIFDGRDNEEYKLATYQAALGNLTVEVLKP